MGTFHCCNCYKIKTNKENDQSSLSKENLPFSNNVSNTFNSASYYILSYDGRPTQSKLISKDDFTRIKLLGKGTFGKVLLVQKKDTKELLAMKILYKSTMKINNQEAHTKTERKILEKIDHPFIVSLKYAFQDERKLYLVTEFMQGGELFFHLRKEILFKEDRARFYIVEIILALEHLHKNNCIYRDLKPENILLDKDGHIKLTDFGLSKLILSKKDQRAYTICGTPEYVAPEVLLDKGYDKSVDWWSMGALLYEMLCGYSPYKSGNKEQKLEIELYMRPVKMHSYFSPEVKSLIGQLLSVDPSTRLGSGPYGSDEVKSHEFFKDIDFDAFLEKKIIPPFVPIISSEDDLNNFDKMFTEQNILESYSEKKNNLNPEVIENINYEGFTYVREDLFDSPK